MKALAIALGLAYAAGLNLYATVGLLGLAGRLGWLGPLPANLLWLTDTWVIAIAWLLFLVEFVATVTPGVSTGWETFHSLVRPPAAAVIAASVVWRDDAHMILIAALFGGVLAVITHTAKLGLRYALDSSSAPRAGILTNLAELALVSAVVLLVWQYPIPTLLVAIAILVGFVVVARVVLRVLRQVFTGHWMPGCGLLQEPRTGTAAVGPTEDED
ncbi:MAG TPA: DUF4126 domain-containing protein [Gemmatimonadaceae bacterium]|nr:DUF4126 domain-containing protein [Gemmatimonadaceae bacterium]